MSTAERILSANAAIKQKLRTASVDDFGAKGDGTTDDTAAIVAAIEYCSIHEIGILLFPRIYRVDATIELVGYRQDHTNKPLMFCSVAGGNEYKSCIVANTGGELFRFIGCHRFTLDLNIVSSLSDAYEYVTNKIPVEARQGCSIAYSVTRSATEVSTHTFSFKGIIQLEHNPAFNSGYGTVAVYNDTCEMDEYTNLWYVADTPIILSKNDLLNITSNPYTLSCKDHHFYGKCVLESHGYGNQCIVFDGVDNVDMYAYGHCRNDNASNAFMSLVGGLQNFNINVDAEGVNFLTKGTGSLNYGLINVTGTTFKKAFTNSIVRHVKCVENINFASECPYIYVDTPIGAEYVGLELSLGYKGAKSYIYNNGYLANCVFGLSNVGHHADLLEIVTSGNTVLNTYTIRDAYSQYHETGQSVQWYWGIPETAPSDAKIGTMYISRSDYVVNGAVAAAIYNGTDFTVIGQHKYRTVNAADIATTVPAFIGEFVIDENKKLYMGWGASAGQFTT